MPRKLRTYRTTAGFFDLAVAAPSMKAALAAWGAGANLFHQGFASVTDDPVIVAAATAQPGVVLRRPVGTTGPFRQHAELPEELPVPKATRPDRRGRQSVPGAATPAREVRAAEAERQRRRAAIAAAQAALDEARHAHESRRAGIETERAALDRRAEAEEMRWRDERKRLEAALRRAGSRGLRVG